MSDSQTSISRDMTATQDVAQNICPLCASQQTYPHLSAPDRFHLRSVAYQIFRCGDCRCVWLATPPSPDEMSHHYTQDYHRAIVSGGEYKSGRRWRGHRQTIGQYKRGGKLLDVGCSSGSFLASMSSGDWELYGTEMDELTAKRAAAHSGATIFVGDTLKAPYPPNSFDLITCFDVLEHVYDPRRFLHQMQQWLKPGGIFFAKVPNIDSWESRVFGSYWFGLELPRHLYHFSPLTLKLLASELGFHELSIAANGPGNHVIHSVRYMYEELRNQVGLSSSPMSEGRQSNIVWRAFRKAFALAVVSPLSRVPASVNAGVIIDMVLEKKS